MLYHLTLGRAGDFDGFQSWVNGGLHGTDLARGFIDSSEFAQRFGGLDDTAFVTQLFQNTVQHGPDGATLARLDGYLDTHSRVDLVALLATDVTLVGSQFSANGMSLIGSL